MWGRRLLELGGLMMMGDGLMGLLYPRRYTSLWRFGPRAWQEVADTLHDHPEVVRALGAAGFGLGLWLAARQLPEHG